MTSPDASQDHREIRDFYEQTYYGKLGIRRCIPWHCRRIARKFGSFGGDMVLDVACGTGEWLEHFASQGAQVGGIDLSARAIAECERVLPQGEFHTGPAEVLPFATGRFDAVTCMGSLEHFIDKPAALREMIRVSTPTARFMILVPNAGFLTRKLGLFRGTHQVAVREDVLEIDQWTALFESVGLSVYSRWRDLHPLSISWITNGSWVRIPLRMIQAFALTLWPVRWQYQVYFFCKKKTP
ncbi:class I SAM-dependent methyltransferase [Pinirhizobacter sp.]|jgi:ubiquinone/menaquinone biosynthesis C-methylase UbiE|uniref:class I SAM-dependent methyltransferase n=1 Tax=Pinirhizobacter sp. TaxID=2950432 RepID=UPI002F3F5B87